MKYFSVDNLDIRGDCIIPFRTRQLAASSNALPLILAYVIIAFSTLSTIIAELKARKSPGDHCITAEVLKAGGEKMVEILDKIFRKVLVDEDIPTKWAKMLATPVHKKGDLHFRAIALLSR